MSLFERLFNKLEERKKITIIKEVLNQKLIELSYDDVFELIKMDLNCYEGDFLFGFEDIVKKTNINIFEYGINNHIDMDILIRLVQIMKDKIDNKIELIRLIMNNDIPINEKIKFLCELLENIEALKVNEKEAIEILEFISSYPNFLKLVELLLPNIHDFSILSNQLKKIALNYPCVIVKYLENNEYDINNEELFPPLSNFMCPENAKYCDKLLDLGYKLRKNDKNILLKCVQMQYLDGIMAKKLYDLDTNMYINYDNELIFRLLRDYYHRYDYIIISLLDKKNIDFNSFCFIEKKFYPNSTDYKNDYKNIFTVACEYRKYKICEKILTMNINIEMEAIRFLIFDKQTELILKILESKKINVNEINNYGYNLLIYSCANKNSEVALKLIELDADVDFISKGSNPALLYACDMKLELVILKILEKSSNTINVKNTSNFTPLLYACMHNMTDIINKLLEYENINIEGLDKTNNNYLMITIKNNNVKMANKIFEKNINVNHFNKNNETALILALDNKLEDLAIKLIQKMDIDTIKLWTIENKRNAWTIANEKKMLNVIQALLDKGF